MCIETVLPLNRKALVGLIMLAVLATGFCCFVMGSRSGEGPAATGAPQDSETLNRATEPNPGYAQPGLPTIVESVPQPEIRGETGQEVASAATSAELPALCESLLHASEGTAELRQVIRRWAETNGPSAATWTARLLPGPTHVEVLTEIALGWGSVDLPAALVWAQTLPQGEGRVAVIEQLGYAAAQTDAAKALELAASLEPSRQRDDLLEHAISQWAAKDFATAVQWAETSVADQDLQQRLIATVAVAVAGQDGAAAATLAATSLTPGEEQDRVAVAVVQRWAQYEPEQAAAWVAQFPETPVRATTVQNLVAFWAAQDREAAGNWLQALPEGTLRASGITAYSQVLAATEIAAR